MFLRDLKETSVPELPLLCPTPPPCAMPDRGVSSEQNRHRHCLLESSGWDELGQYTLGEGGGIQVAMET